MEHLFFSNPFGSFAYFFCHFMIVFLPLVRRKFFGLKRETIYFCVFLFLNLWVRVVFEENVFSSEWKTGFVEIYDSFTRKMFSSYLDMVIYGCAYTNLLSLNVAFTSLALYVVLVWCVYACASTSKFYFSFTGYNVKWVFSLSPSLRFFLFYRPRSSYFSRFKRNYSFSLFLYFTLLDFFLLFTPSKKKSIFLLGCVEYIYAIMCAIWCSLFIEGYYFLNSLFLSWSCVYVPNRKFIE